MPIDTTYRADAVEMMDDFSLEGEILTDALDKIAAINRLLGGNKVTLQGVRQLLAAIPEDREIKIVDLGCGNGDMLRALADIARDEKRNFRLTGVDANSHTTDYAKKLSVDYPNINFRCENIFELDFEAFDCDIWLVTLTLHHFDDSAIVTLLEQLTRHAKLGIVINDLQRSRLAYQLFRCVCFVFGLNPMSREDGLVSILRGFKKNELTAFSKKLSLRNYSIRRKWAFRYQWIIARL